MNRLGTNPLDFIGAAPQVKSAGDLPKQTKKTTPKARVSKTSAPVNWAAKGCKEGYTRSMLFVRKDYIEKLKDVAYWDRKQIKEALEEALSLYFKGRSIKPRPHKV